MISTETVRHWMIADGLWVPHARRKARVYQPRYRRDCLGELIQIDGSHHDWFEGRASKCGLLVYIDDATGRLMHLRFCETESAFDYMLATREYIDKHGKPVAFYSVKHAVFRVSQAESRRTGTTQFGRVLHDLNIELICANSSQAKGRVERANLTLQDRLIKEMRLESISSIEEANVWLDSFILDFNRRFAKAPKYPKNLHRPVNEQPAEVVQWTSSTLPVSAPIPVQPIFWHLSRPLLRWLGSYYWLYLTGAFRSWLGSSVDPFWIS
jgi:hypothetical protein